MEIKKPVEPVVFRIRNHLVMKNLALIYWHVGGVITWLLGAITTGGILIAYLDGKPLGDTLYLAFITALTIGYGDMTPVGAISKVIAIGIGFLGILFTGIIMAVSLRALEMTITEQRGNGAGNSDSNT